MDHSNIPTASNSVKPSSSGVSPEDAASASSSSSVTERILREAREALQDEPELCRLLRQTVLAEGVESFDDAVIPTVCYRLRQSNGSNSDNDCFCPRALRDIFRKAFCDDRLELGHTLPEAVRLDALAVVDRDPACHTLLEVVLFAKGFAALVAHRVAHRTWHQHLSKGKRHSLTALWLQSQASCLFGVDIHPAAQLGAGLMLDHGTGVVIGETATLGDGCTLLHGVTLGGTGKDTGDRHPKIGAHVLLGAGCSVLGNIKVGDRVKVGAGSIVLRPLPCGATAVGAPAKIIGKTREEDPAVRLDEGLTSVRGFPAPTTTGSKRNSSGGTATTESMTSRSSSGSMSENEDSGNRNASLETNRQTSDRDICPYREYAAFAKAVSKTLPSKTNTKNILTIGDFEKRFAAAACSPCQQWAAFFALDSHNQGYLRKDDLTPSFVTKTLTEATTLDVHQIGKFLQLLRTEKLVASL